MARTLSRKAQGLPERTPQPSPHVTAILRRTVAGFIMATNTTDEQGRPVTHYCYDDGTIIRNAMGRPVTAREISRMIGEGWLIPIKGEALPLVEGQAGPAQRYRARTIADGLLPKYRNA
jgi:hypothetical protein